MGRLEVVWSERAVRDLEAIERFIAADSAHQAERWVAKLIAAADAAAAAPLAARMVPELGRPELREVIVKRYRVVYRVGKKRIEVLTVFEGHRRPRL